MQKIRPFLNYKNDKFGGAFLRICMIHCFHNLSLEFLKLQSSCLMPFYVKELDWKLGLLTPSPVLALSTVRMPSFTLLVLIPCLKEKNLVLLSSSLPNFYWLVGDELVKAWWECYLGLQCQDQGKLIKRCLSSFPKVSALVNYSLSRGSESPRWGALTRGTLALALAAH